MHAYTIRKGTLADTEWLYSLFRDTNKELIEQSWGWDERLQREAFETILPGDRFTILESNGAAVGGYHIEIKPEHIWLELIIVEPGHQNQGLGSHLLDQIKENSKREGLPIKLSVLRINPASTFYSNRGFSTESEDEHSLKLIWRPESV